MDSAACQISYQLALSNTSSKFTFRITWHPLPMREKKAQQLVQKTMYISLRGGSFHICWCPGQEEESYSDRPLYSITGPAYRSPPHLWDQTSSMPSTRSWSAGTCSKRIYPRPQAPARDTPLWAGTPLRRSRSANLCLRDVSWLSLRGEHEGRGVSNQICSPTPSADPPMFPPSSTHWKIALVAATLMSWVLARAEVTVVAFTTSTTQVPSPTTLISKSHLIQGLITGSDSPLCILNGRLTSKSPVPRCPKLRCVVLMAMRPMASMQLSNFNPPPKELPSHLTLRWLMVTSLELLVTEDGVADVFDVFDGYSKPPWRRGGGSKSELFVCRLCGTPDTNDETKARNRGILGTQRRGIIVTIQARTLARWSPQLPILGFSTETA